MYFSAQNWEPVSWVRNELALSIKKLMYRDKNGGVQKKAVGNKWKKMTTQKYTCSKTN